MSDRDDLEARIADYDLVLADDGASMDLASHTRVARALVDKGNALLDLGREQEAIVCFGQAVSQYLGAGEADLRELVALALRRKALALIKLGRDDEAAATFDDVVARFEDASEPELRESVAVALGGRATIEHRSISAQVLDGGLNGRAIGVESTRSDL